MAVVLPSDESAHFASGLRRSHSQPKFSSKQTGFRQSASASRISDAAHRHTQQPSHPDAQSIPVARPARPPRAAAAAPAAAAAAAPCEPASHPYQIPVFSDDSASSSASSPRAAAASPPPTKLLVPSLRLPPRLDRPGYGSSPSGTDDGTDADVALDYSHYDGVSYFNPAEDPDDPPCPRSGMGLRVGGLGVPADSYTASPNDNNTLSSTGPSRTNSSEFDLFEHVAEDDTAVRAMPSRHVDYLSHNWREEDIWESWKYIVSRRGDYSNSARLENASWRTWMKAKNKLKTVSPETLNWLKDCDVTWLYGPLQTGHNTLGPGLPTDSVELTKSNSFLAGNKKPILKKRSMSEIMLQRSLSASSLIKQAAAAVQAQQKDGSGRRLSRPRLERATTDYVTFPFSSRLHSTGPPSMLPSTSSSGIVSPSAERKHIHFNEQVEQCIAVDVKEEEEEEEDDDDVALGGKAAGAAALGYDSDSSDDGAIMMKRTVSKHRMRPHLPRRMSSHAGVTESKTIAMLPSTTLKYRDDVLDDDDDASDPASAGAGPAMKHSYRSPVLSPSSSQETLRPSKASGALFFGADEEEDDDGDRKGAVDSSDNNDSDSDSDDGLVVGGGARRRGGLASSASTSRLGHASIDSALAGAGSSSSSSSSSGGGGGGGGGLKRTTSTGSLAAVADPAGMRRTPSGMLMPYDEGEPAGGGNGGLVGRVIDTVNTARDIVHVIWNVGWRK